MVIQLTAKPLNAIAAPLAAVEGCLFFCDWLPRHRQPDSVARVTLEQVRSSGFLVGDRIFFVKEVIGLNIRPTGQLSASSLNYHSKPLKN